MRGQREKTPMQQISATANWESAQAPATADVAVAGNNDQLGGLRKFGSRNRIRVVSLHDHTGTAIIVGGGCWLCADSR